MTTISSSVRLVGFESAPQVLAVCSDVALLDRMVLALQQGTLTGLHLESIELRRDGSVRIVSHPREGGACDALAFNIPAKVISAKDPVHAALRFAQWMAILEAKKEVQRLTSQLGKARGHLEELMNQWD